MVCSLLQRATSLYSLPDFGILEAVKTKPAPNQAPAVQDKRPPPDPKKREDFYANVGEAIRVLRAEIPTLFQQDLTCKLTLLIPHARSLSLLWVLGLHLLPGINRLRGKILIL